MVQLARKRVFTLYTPHATTNTDNSSNRAFPARKQHVRIALGPITPVAHRLESSGTFFVRPPPLAVGPPLPDLESALGQLRLDGRIQLELPQASSHHCRNDSSTAGTCWRWCPAHRRQLGLELANHLSHFSGGLIRSGLRYRSC